MEKKHYFSEAVRGKLERYVNKELHRRSDGTVKTYVEMASDLGYCPESKTGKLLYLIKEMYPSIAEEMRNRRHSWCSDRIKQALKMFHGYIQSGQHLINSDTVKTVRWIAAEIDYGITFPTISRWVHRFYPQLIPLFKKNKKKYSEQQHLKAA